MIHPVIVIGAGPAGLAAAACLRGKGVDPLVLEQAPHVGAAWRGHYQRLHLHTDRRHSALPGLPIPASAGTYPSRQQVIDYLEDYAAHFRLRISFGTRLRRLTPGAAWQVETDDQTLQAENVVMCTGFAQRPHRPRWPGDDRFAGSLLHSADYDCPAPFAGKRLLVVGFGNSGGEIALDLAEAGISVDLSVRGPVNVVPRDILGIPILTLTIAMRWLPYRLADLLNRPILRLATGDIAALGLTPAGKGPMAQVIEDGRVPLLDIGTLAALRDGRIGLRPGIHSFDATGVTFADGGRAAYDAVILATGYRSDLRDLLPGMDDLLEAAGRPQVSGAQTRPGLYFVNYRGVATGQLRQCGIEARAIARAIAG
ncbi:flavin-containing monooxygenase [Sedimentitalea sp. HM32M-2]|uniref:flavin-containing monooxygenase n=1 Tax=Sedimentitalea sp. HM32M-2 TaxID=3351566 RepID=UPI0036331B4D